MSLYGRWMHRRERILTRKDTNRKVFPFEWGLEWVEGAPSEGDPLSRLLAASEWALEDSDAYFEVPAQTLLPESIAGEFIFPTPLPGPHEYNNVVPCRVFDSPGRDRAVVVLPQWNADEGSHVGLCRLLQRRLGATVVRHCLPYHERRRPPGMARADYMVSPNLGRTLTAIRQAALELRQIVAWLQQRGFRRIAVTGTSIGSCVSYLAFVHDPRIDVGVFNFVSSYVADVVWRGIATRYVRRGMEGHISLDDLRRCWAPVSPFLHIPRLRGDGRSHLMISARYDLTFLPELSQQVFAEYRRHGLTTCQFVDLPCGHYTTAKFPFKYIDGWHIVRFLERNL